MAFLIRPLVSADRLRFKQGEYDLDLTYITPRIIAMGFPASGLEGTWRNSINEVAMMLKKYHSGKYMIWNLSDRPYDYTIFEDQVMDFGFPDHHAPPLNLLFKIMLSLHNWIRADPKNVAVIHCLGGKGRTGTVIGCYLLLTGLFDDPIMGLEYFANKRSSIALGVTQPAQRSSVCYFAKILQQNFIPYQVPFCLSKIVMYGVNQQRNFFRPIIKIYDVRNYPKKLIYTTECAEETENNNKRWAFSEETPNSTIVWQFPKERMTVKGDVLVKVYHLPPNAKKIYLFRFSFHTAFLDGGVLTLTESDLSTEKKFSAYHRDDFFLHLFFEPPAISAPETDASDGENETMEMYCKMFQKLYADRLVNKLDALDPPLPKISPEPKNIANNNNNNNNLNKSGDLKKSGDLRKSGELKKSGDEMKKSSSPKITRKPPSAPLPRTPNLKTTKSPPDFSSVEDIKEEEESREKQEEARETNKEETREKQVVGAKETKTETTHSNESTTTTQDNNETITNTEANLKEAKEEKQEKQEKAEIAENQEKVGNQEKVENLEKAEKQEKVEKPEKPEKEETTKEEANETEIGYNETNELKSEDLPN